MKVIRFLGVLVLGILALATVVNADMSRNPTEYYNDSAASHWLYDDGNRTLTGVRAVPGQSPTLYGWGLAGTDVATYQNTSSTNFSTFFPGGEAVQFSVANGANPSPTYTLVDFSLGVNATLTGAIRKKILVPWQHNGGAGNTVLGIQIFDKDDNSVIRFDYWGSGQCSGTYATNLGGCLSTAPITAGQWANLTFNYTGTLWVVNYNGHDVYNVSSSTGFGKLNIIDHQICGDARGCVAYVEDFNVCNDRNACPEAAGGPVVSPSVSFVAPTPTNNTVRNTQAVINMTSTNNASVLWFGNSTNLLQSNVVLNVSSMANGSVNYLTSVTAQLTYYYKGSADNGATNTSLYQFTYDSIVPNVTINTNNAFNITNQTTDPYNASKKLNISFFDTNTLYSFSLNFTYNPNGTTYFSYLNQSISGANYNFSGSLDTNGWPVGNYTVVVLVKDSNGIGGGLNNFSQNYLFTKKTLVLNSATILPAAPSDEDNLMGFCQATEGNGLNLNLEYIWYNQTNIYQNSSLSGIQSGDNFNVNNVSSNFTNINEIWKISCRANINGFYSNWTNSSGKNISSLGIDNCQVFTNRTMSFNFLDFNGTAVPVNVSATVGFKLLGIDTPAMRNYSFVNNSINNFNYCINPDSAQVYGDIQLQFQNGVAFYNYFTNGTILNSTSKNVTLRLDGQTAVTATVFDNINNVVEGAYIYVQRYDFNTGNYILTGVYRTNFEGQAILYLTLDSVYYRFLIYYPYNLLIQTNTPTYVGSNTIEFRINLYEAVAQEFFDTYSVDGALTFSNLTNNFRFIYSSPSVVVDSATLRVYKVDWLGTTLVNTSSAIGESGTLLAGVTPANDTTYIARAFVSVFLFCH